MRQLAPAIIVLGLVGCAADAAGGRGAGGAAGGARADGGAGAAGATSSDASAADGSHEASTFGASACETCLRNACAAEFSPCEADPACAAYLACYDACPPGPMPKYPDVGCEQACPHPTANLALSSLHDCTGTSGFQHECATPCGQ